MKHTRLVLGILILVLSFMLFSCQVAPGEDGKTPTIEISEDGYWVINGEKTNVKAENTESEENEQELDFFLKDDGTYAVGIGNAKYLSKITIPSTYRGRAVTEIAYDGFASASELKEIIIPDSVTSIGDDAFRDCTGLTSIVIPDSVTSIGSHAFAYCRGLTSVVIGNGVTSIGFEAFSYCFSLTDVYYTGSQEEWKDIYIADNNYYLASATIHYNYKEN